MGDICISGRHVGAFLWVPVEAEVHMHGGTTQWESVQCWIQSLLFRTQIHYRKACPVTEATKRVP